MNMESLNLPAATLSFSESNGKITVFDPLRKRWVAYTPEESVRQHVISFLIYSLGYSSGLLGVEQQIKINRRVFRTDLVAWTSSGKPWLLVECKAPDVALTPEVLEQAVRYNITLKASYLAITNGIKHHVFSIDTIKGISVCDGWPMPPQ